MCTPVVVAQCAGRARARLRRNGRATRAPRLPLPHPTSPSPHPHLFSLLPPRPLSSFPGGFALGLAFMTAATFVVVSYTELQDKIGRQAAAGEDVYQLKGGRGAGGRPPPPPAQKAGKAARRRKG